MKTAILVDLDFFLRSRRRHLAKKGREIGVTPSHDPERVAEDLWRHCIRHVKKHEDSLYRILVYDCPPADSKVLNPINNQNEVLKKTPQYSFRTDVHQCLRRKRSIALRLGKLSKVGSWVFRDTKKHTALLTGKVRAEDLMPTDIRYHYTQKGVDMKIGLDIASLSYKRLVDRIVLISGDTDFVPAAKLARREGIDVVLDPMGQHIGEELSEHIDGRKTTLNMMQLVADENTGSTT